MRLTGIIWLDLLVKHNVEKHEVREVLESSRNFRFVEKGRRVGENVGSSLSQASSYQQMGEFWDTHDLSDYWSQTRKARFEVKIDSEVTYYALENSLSEKLQTLAKKKGVSSDTLLNLWIQQKLQEQAVP
ncbi:MAG: hypothetical protein HY961_19505 [Ignavibacteriae bacterium]|nr:hypothetical protein [Ignavibacteriota bacterium]